MFDIKPRTATDMSKMKLKDEAEGPSVPGEIRLKTDSSFDLSISVLWGVSEIKLTEENSSNLPNFGMH